jgi:hypothetical protein
MQDTARRVVLKGRDQRSAAGALFERFFLVVGVADEPLDLKEQR